MKKAAMAGALGFGLLIALLLSMFLIIASDDEGGGSNSGLYIGVNLSAEVLAHQPMVEKYARYQRLCLCPACYYSGGKRGQAGGRYAVV